MGESGTAEEEGWIKRGEEEEGERKENESFSPSSTPKSLSLSALQIRRKKGPGRNRPVSSSVGYIKPRSSGWDG